METAILALLLILISAVGVLLWIVLKRQAPKGDSQSLIMLQNQMQELNRTLDTKLGESTKQMSDSVKAQLGESAKIVRNVTEGLTKLEETNKQVISFADQLKQLQDVLKNPKQRGILGEYYLESVLQNVLPPDSFKMQYVFKNGEIVDAVVFVKDKVVPIDSKFSLENYNRLIEASDATERDKYEKAFVNDLKLRITETSKYIRPEEGTTEFAFMFIPSEGIYYDLLSNKVGDGDESLIQRAAGKHRVIIVSPTSFLAYLQTVLQGLKAMDIEDKAKDIIKNVDRLRKHLSKYDDYYKKLGSAIGVTVSHYNAGYKELGKIDKDVLHLTDEPIGVEPLALDKPVKDE